MFAEQAVEFEAVQKEYEELIKEEVREKAEEKKEEGKYVYCVIKSDEEMVSFGDLGIEDTGEVYAIPYKGFAAVVSADEGIRSEGRKCERA